VLGAAGAHSSGRGSSTSSRAEYKVTRSGDGADAASASTSTGASPAATGTTSAVATRTGPPTAGASHAGCLSTAAVCTSASQAATAAGASSSSALPASSTWSSSSLETVSVSVSSPSLNSPRSSRSCCSTASSCSSTSASAGGSLSERPPTASATSSTCASGCAVDGYDMDGSSSQIEPSASASVSSSVSYEVWLRMAGVEGEKAGKGEAKGWVREAALGVTSPMWCSERERGDEVEEVLGWGKARVGGVPMAVDEDVAAAALRGEERVRRGLGENRTVRAGVGASVRLATRGVSAAGDGESGERCLAPRRAEGVPFSLDGLVDRGLRVVTGVPSGMRGVERCALRSEGDLSRRERAKAEGVRGCRLEGAAAGEGADSAARSL